MGKGFRSFKRKMCTGAILRALSAGLSVGTVAVAVQWLIAKLTLGETDWLRFASVAAIPAILVALLVLLCLWPTNRRLARRLDKTLGLNERVQTMVAYRRDGGEMAALQREDTERLLLATPRRRARGVLTWLFVLCPLVAVLAVVGTVLVPAKEPPAPPPVVDTTWRLDVFQEQKLRDLIAYVEKSDMERQLRLTVVEELEDLLAELKNLRKESLMKDAVVAAIVDIHEATAAHNTYDLLTASMGSIPSEPVKRLGNAMSSLKPLFIGEQLAAIRESIGGPEGVASATLLATALRQSVTLSELEPTDELALAVTAFADALAGVSAETTEAELDALRADAEEAILDALEPESVNEAVESYTVNRLMEIFGIPAASLPEGLLVKPYDPSTEGSYDPDDDDDDDPNHSGGLGSGEVLFGSNDTIYDPDTGTYVPYGEVLRRYHAIVLEHMGDGNLPEELEDMLHDYFAKLSDGGDQKQE